MQGVSGRGSIWDEVWNEARAAGSDPRRAIAYKKGQLGQNLGRDYWGQFQQQRFQSMTQRFDDLAQQREQAAAPVTSGRRRGVNTGGVGGAYARRAGLGQLPSSMFDRQATGGSDLFAGTRRYFEGATTRQPGQVDFQSLSRGGRTQLRNIAFQQFFSPELSGAQEEAMGGAAKTAVARGIRGRAVSGLSQSVGNRFLAGNRRAALDFITQDVLQSQRDYAASTTNPGQAILRNESDIHNFLARTAAFNMLSQGRTAFQGQAQMERSGLRSAQGAAQAILQGDRPETGGPSSLAGAMSSAGRYANTVNRANLVGTGILRGTEFEGEGFSRALQGTGFMSSMSSLAGAAGGAFKERLLRENYSGAISEAQANAQRSGRASTFSTGQNVLDTVTAALQRDLFTPGSSMRASDIALGALERDLGLRAGREDYSVDTVGGSADYRRLFESAFSIPGGTSGQLSPIMRRLTMPAMSGGGFGRGQRPAAGPAWMTPELHALRVGAGSERDLQDKQNFIKNQLMRNTAANQGIPFMNESALYNSYNQQMNALRQGSDYLADIRSQFLSPMSF
jgi:hypothetical protein